METTRCYKSSSTCLVSRQQQQRVLEEFHVKAHVGQLTAKPQQVITRVEPDTRLKRVSGTDKALLPSTSIIRVIRVNICARIE